MTAFIEIYIDQGTTFRNVINLADDLTNVPINVANYEVKCEMRRSYYSQNTSGIINCDVGNSSNGEIIMSMTPANTANLKPGRHLFDVKTTDTQGVVNRVLEGIIHVTPQVTR